MMTRAAVQEGTNLKPEHTGVTASEAGHTPVTAPEGGFAVSENCKAVSGILSRVGDKWSVLVVMLLGSGPRRFNELKRMIGGVSQRMLTLTLRGLERDGLVKRTIFPTIPPRVEYELTALGRSLQEPVKSLGLWAFENHAAIESARKRFDEAHG
jgi:DNA-binding HxlR family transcriptional regulator